jgi:hypothetical protein
MVSKVESSLRESPSMEKEAHSFDISEFGFTQLTSMREEKRREGEGSYPSAED